MQEWMGIRRGAGDRDVLEGRELFWAYGPKYSL
jgi:hypothetical protein